MAPRDRHLRLFSTSACEFDWTCRSAGHELPEGGHTDGLCCAHEAGFGAAELLVELRVEAAVMRETP